MIRWFAVLSRAFPTQTPLAMFPEQADAVAWIATQADPADLYVEVIMWTKVTQS